MGGTNRSSRIVPWLVALTLFAGPRLLGDESVAPTSLGELRAEPAARLGRTVSVVVQVRAVGGTWESWLSRFTPDRYVALEAWGDEQLLWVESEWTDSFARLYARTGSPAQRALAAALPHERWELEVVPRELFLGEPWCEVVGARPVEGGVSEGTILHASKAIELARTGQYELARAELERAVAGPLPEHALAELERLGERIERALERSAAPARR